ncbi:MAG TPA: hypothetical protein VMI31_06325 [Fimbriimonadaceae bacterium]|nr:hypothetical protein [Fimbriimonadaceae bacterium]
MADSDRERLVVVTSTPDGVAPLTPGERSMLEEEGDQVEQTAVVRHSFPDLLPTDEARLPFEKAKAAYAGSDAFNTVLHARLALDRSPNYLPARIYEELGMNIARGKDLDECAERLRGAIELGEAILAGRADAPPTDRPIEREHVLEILDIAHYNLSDRLMRLGKYREALDHLRASEALPKTAEGRMKRLMKEASLLYRLRDHLGSIEKLKQARAIDRELFLLLRERMAFDGHAGVDQPV